MNNKQIIENLFNEARARSFVNYIFTLLRVTCIESYEKDPLFKFRDDVLNRKVDKKSINSSNIFWGLIVNLSRIANGHSYNPYIFEDSKDNNYFAETCKLISQDLAEYLKVMFQIDLNTIGDEQYDFILQFFNKYHSEIKSFIGQKNLFKLPKFNVLELLVDKKKGLEGFKIYFSNGSHAEFLRGDRGTSIINIILDEEGVGFMVGNLDKMCDEWRMGDRCLYEVGLPGRYNNSEEWKPIVYPGSSDHLQKEAIAKTKDERAQGILFYMFCTGHRVIEFVVKMAIKLPEQHTILPGEINLEIVERDEKNRYFSNEFIYDGWLELSSGSLETIIEGLNNIQRAMEGLSFTFNSKVRWNVKYKIIGHLKGAAIPNSREISYLNKMIQATQKEKDLIIDTAMNWYQLGLLTQNPLNAFLCYHIAIEGLAIKLVKGELISSNFFGFKKEDKKSRKQRISKSFEKYYKKYYKTDLEKMIKESYFDCIGSIKHHLKRAFEEVFGKDHKIIKDYFESNESIWTIRGELVHGEYSDWHHEKYTRVWYKLPLVQEIVESFITRVVLQIPSEKEIPGWSRNYQVSIGTYNPNNTLVVSRLDILPNKDWKIRAEWVD